MPDRTAIDTIKGYFYQFDYAIAKLLELREETDTITVEGIEDVDINTATEEIAIQCKYYAKTEYNHSVIAKPIRLMLDHYKQVTNGQRQKVRYKLYGFFKSGQHKLTLPINITFLKDNFLTFTESNVKCLYHTKLGISDTELNNFINLLDIDISAIEFDEQVLNIFDLLKKRLKCNDFEAEHYFYNNALKVIKDISVQSSEVDRRISKSQFIEKINFKQALFNQWFIAYKGEEKWFSNLRNEYFTILNIPPFERFFIIEIPSIDYVRADLKELMYYICRKWSKLSLREPNPFCPYIYLHNIEQKELIAIKSEFQSEGFTFIDGFDFHGALFNAKSLSRKLDDSRHIKAKIINDLEKIDDTLKEIKKTKEIYQFYYSSPFFDINYSNIKQVKIQFSKLQDIKKIV
jgi:hypothetical protein